MTNKELGFIYTNMTGPDCKALSISKPNYVFFNVGDSGIYINGHRWGGDHTPEPDVDIMSLLPATPVNEVWYTRHTKTIMAPSDSNAFYHSGFESDGAGGVQYYRRPAARIGNRYNVSTGGVWTFDTSVDTLDDGASKTAFEGLATLDQVCMSGIGILTPTFLNMPKLRRVIFMDYLIKEPGFITETQIDGWPYGYNVLGYFLQDGLLIGSGGDNVNIDSEGKHHIDFVLPTIDFVNESNTVDFGQPVGTRVKDILGYYQIDKYLSGGGPFYDAANAGVAAIDLWLTDTSYYRVMDLIQSGDFTPMGGSIVIHKISDYPEILSWPDYVSPVTI